MRRTRFRIPALAALAALALATACSTLRVSVDYDPATDFSRYKTFTLKHGVAPPDPFAADRLDVALTSALTAKGLTRVAEGSGDLAFYSHFKMGTETQLNTTTYGYGGWNAWRWGDIRAQTTTVEKIPTGRLVVDAVDAKTGKAVWRGIAKDRISSSGTPGEYLEQAHEAARQLFADFPPASRR